MAGKQQELMRKSHFHIGSFSNNFSTLYSDSFIGSPVSRSKVERKVDIERTQIVLGNEQSSKRPETESRQHYISYAKDKNHDEMSASIKKDLATHHFSLGNNYPMYSTTSKETYKPHKSKGHSMNDELHQLLKTSNVPFNYSPKAIESTNRAEFYAKSNDFTKNFQVSKNLISDFKRAHFDLGFSLGTRASTMRDSYSPNRNFVPGKLQEVPKNHSVVLGYDRKSVRPWDDKEKFYQLRRNAVRTVVKN